VSDHDHGDGPATDPLADLDLHPLRGMAADTNRLRRDEPDYVLDSGRFFYRPLVSVNHDARPDGMPRGHVSDHEPSGVPWPADDVRLREQRPAESVG
jgi:hypothetical protein